MTLGRGTAAAAERLSCRACAASALAVFLVLGAGAAARERNPRAPAAEAEPPAPYRQSGREPREYRGPEGQEPAPAVSEIAIAFFGPGDPDHAELGAYWRGASLAAEEENAAGGVRLPGGASLPLRLLPVWSERPWQAGITDLTRLVYERRVVGVIGGLDGSTTHLALQSALKSRFLLLTPGSTDATTDHANVPWLFSLPPSDAAIASVIADAVAAACAARASGGRFVIAAATDHDSHASLVALQRALERARLVPASVVEFEARAGEEPALARRLCQGEPRAVVVVAAARAAGRLAAALREAGHGGTIVGGAPLASGAFLSTAGAAAEGVVAPLLLRSASDWAAFEQAYAMRWGEPPDLPAGLAYDAVRLVAAAVRRAGPNRALVRDAVQALAPWRGATGEVGWDAFGRATRRLRMGVWRAGRLAPVPGPASRGGEDEGRASGRATR